MRHLLLSFAALCALSLVLDACGETRPSDHPTEAILVRTAIVKEAEAESGSYTGTVAARVESQLGFRVSGKVLERMVDTGQPVKRGQVLMLLDPIDLELAAQAQQEAVVAARARARQTAEDESRYRDLLGTGAISISAYDQIKTAAEAADAQLRAAEAQAEIALNGTRYSELVADADGYVMETLAEPGQVITAGHVVIRVARTGAREAVIMLPETLRPAVGSVGQAMLFGRESETVPTKLRQLSEVADQLTRTFEARYVLERELANAPLGSTVTVRIPKDEPSAQEGLWVPIGSLYDAGKGPGVWRINGETSRVSWQPVHIQHLDEDSARIAADHIKQGDLIVALGAHLLREDQEVRVADHNTVAASQGVRP